MIRKIKNAPKKEFKVKAPKSLPKLKKELQEVFNLFIRLRDTKGDGGHCISCGNYHTFKNLQAGHYISVKQSEALRFHEDNTHIQCVHCNIFNQGNFPGYTTGLTAKIGKERVEKLMLARHNFSKLSRFEVSYLIGQYKEKVRKLRS